MGNRVTGEISFALNDLLVYFLETDLPVCNCLKQILIWGGGERKLIAITILLKIC